MSYKAIYRKFRPTKFSDVLGQEHITTILKNQITNNNIGHAYLFSGTRGTGKTSTARIFARAVNCTEDDVPCNECEICKGILQQSIMDIIEIDAASNNKVDDVRELRENSKYPPSKCRYKVYIVDEAHMLTPSASNALLKVLEEPPEHLIFILATTEPEKLPATILSRCQRHDFKRVSVEDIVKNMQNIAEKIDLDISTKALELIARNSDGAMRDALSILDQCLSFSEEEITYEYVISVLGIVNQDLMFEIVDDILSGSTEELLDSLGKVIEQGIDINQFIKNLIMHFRNLMIAKTSQDLENSIDGTDDYIEDLKLQVKDIDLEKILAIIDTLSQTENKCKWSTQPRILLEVDLIKIVNLPSRLDLMSLVDRIDKLENQIASGNIVQARKPQATTSQATEKKPQQQQRQEQPQQKEQAQVEKIANNKDIDFTAIKNGWPKLLNMIKDKNIPLHALIVEGNPISFKNTILTIGFDEKFGFHKEALDKASNKQSMEKIISESLNTEVELRLVMENTMVLDDEQEKQALVNDVIDVFGEDLVEVED